MRLKAARYLGLQALWKSEWFPVFIDDSEGDSRAVQGQTVRAKPVGDFLIDLREHLVCVKDACGPVRSNAQPIAQAQVSPDGNAGLAGPSKIDRRPVDRLMIDRP